MSTNEPPYSDPAQPVPVHTEPAAPVQTAAATSRRTGNVPGRASFIIAIAMVSVSLVFQVLTYALPLAITTNALPYQTMSGVIAAGSIVTGLLALAAIVFGIIGLTRPGGARAMAAAGTALGAATLLSLIASAVLPLLFYGLTSGGFYYGGSD